MVLGLGLVVLSDTWDHLEGGASDGVSFHFFELFVIVCFEGGDFIDDFDEFEYELFEVFDAG